MLPKAFGSAHVVIDSPCNINVRCGAGFPQSTLGLLLLSNGSPTTRLKPRATAGLGSTPHTDGIGTPAGAQSKAVAVAAADTLV